jgi:predicted CxxxxCH...CXXCH cytochrome family protein
LYGTGCAAPGTCTSCHASPPNGSATTAYPNVGGAHGKHLALASIPGGANVVNCDTCHSGLGSRTLAHYNRANNVPGENALRVSPGDVAFVSPFPYTAKNGGPSRFDNSALTCSAVKCHGGSPLAPAPNWQTGSIAVTQDAGCRLCHNASGSAPSQYNDLTINVFTEHLDHVNNRGVRCTVCHDVSLLTPARHFGNLMDNNFPPGAARATISSALLYSPPLTGPVDQQSYCGGIANGTGCHD